MGIGFKPFDTVLLELFFLFPSFYFLLDLIEKALRKLAGQALKIEIDVTNACPYPMSVSPI